MIMMASKGHFWKVFGYRTSWYTLIRHSNLDTNTATDAELFRQHSDFGIWSYFNAKFSHSDNRTWSFALLSTSFRLTFIGIDDSDTGLLIRFISLAITRHSENKKTKWKYVNDEYNQENINTSAKTLQKRQNIVLWEAFKKDYQNFMKVNSIISKLWVNLTLVTDR